jgi:8-oxo-dGTP pyrophosphatase MutT (NUDIX family)
VPQIMCNIIEACIFSFENKEPLYLMLRRSKSETLYPDMWQIVTGSIEKGETAVHGALREVKEETGYTPTKLWIVPHVNTFYVARNDTLQHTVIFAMQVHPKTNPILSDEHYQYKWCSLEKAKEMLVWHGQIEALQIIHEYIVRGKKAAEFSELSI